MDSMTEKADKHWVEIFALHSFIFYINFNSLVYDVQNVKDAVGHGWLDYEGYGGKFKFLTFWCQVRKD